MNKTKTELSRTSFATQVSQISYLSHLSLESQASHLSKESLASRLSLASLASSLSRESSEQVSLLSHVSLVSQASQASPSGYDARDARDAVKRIEGISRGVRRNALAVDKALDVAAAELADQFDLVLCLDALGGGLHVQRVGERDDRLDDRGVAVARRSRRRARSSGRS